MTLRMSFCPCKPPVLISIIKTFLPETIPCQQTFTHQINTCMSGNRELYVRDNRDVIILLTLQHKKTIYETNDLSYNRGFKLLTSQE